MLLRMPYQSYISRDRPALCLFLIDQSAEPSLAADEIHDSPSFRIATAINSWFHNILISCSGDSLYNFFDVLVIGYRTNSDDGPYIGPAWQGPLRGAGIVSLQTLNNNCVRMHSEFATFFDDETGEPMSMEIERPIWIDPVATGSRPMCRALRFARARVEKWIASHRLSVPPFVFHFAKGRSTDGDPRDEAEKLRALKTDDGNTLLTSIYISTDKSAGQFHSVRPNDDHAAAELFDMASPMPSLFRPVLKIDRSVTDARCFGRNVDGMALLQIIGELFGTRFGLRDYDPPST